MKDTVRTLEVTAIDLSKEVVSFIDRNKDESFFLVYPITNIHFSLDSNGLFKGTTKAGVYGEFGVEFDWAVQQVVDALERNGISDNTIVVVTSNDGARPHPDLNGHLCNGPWSGTKRQLKPNGEFLLYNLKADPKEARNLSEKHPEKVLELRQLLEQYRSKIRSTPTS
jgi:hypothetical protein